MITIREISIEEAAIESKWAEEMPLWWRLVDKSVSRRTKGPTTRIGVFEDKHRCVRSIYSELVVIYTLQEIGPQMIDAHLSCKRGTKPEVITGSTKTVMRKLLSIGYTKIFAWPLRRNFGLIRMMKACGFKDTGVRMLMGQMGNRPAEWIQLGAINE